MSFTRANPSGWSLGAKISSSALNQIDIDHANALDKVNGDTLQDVVNMSGAAQLQASVANGIKSTVNGGIALGAGTGDWIQFVDGSNNPQPRSRLRWRPFQFSALSAGWAVNGDGISLHGPQAASPFQTLLMPEMHQGATLASVTFLFNYPITVPAGQPTNTPTFNILRYPMSPGAATFTGTSLGGGIQTGAVTLSNNLQTLTYTCSANNVIDTTQFIYVMLITDNNGTNAQSIFYYGYEMFFSQITQLSFP